MARKMDARRVSSWYVTTGGLRVPDGSGLRAAGDEGEHSLLAHQHGERRTVFRGFLALQSVREFLPASVLFCACDVWLVALEPLGKRCGKAADPIHLTGHCDGADAGDSAGLGGGVPGAPALHGQQRSGGRFAGDRALPGGAIHGRAQAAGELAGVDPVDAISVGLFVYKHLYLTSFLYGSFIVMCVGGYSAWRRTKLRQEAA